MSTPTLIISGTNTGVGKTVVAAALARALCERGCDVVAIKPIESGCTGEHPADDEDGVRLADATGQTDPKEALVRLAKPVAPLLAADEAGVTLNFEAIIRRVQVVASDHQLALVEGAGGLLSPLTWDHTALDLSIALSAPIILVASDSLGTLSQTRLAWEHCRQTGRDVAAVVLSAPAIADESTGTNAAILSRLGVGPMHTVPRLNTVEAGVRALGSLAQELWS